MSIVDCLANPFESAEVFIWDLKKLGRENIREIIRIYNRKTVFLREDSGVLDSDRGLILFLKEGAYSQGELKVIDSDSFFCFKPFSEKTKKLSYDSVKGIIVVNRYDFKISVYRYLN